MADIKQIIDDNIYQNGQQRITGIVMNSVLKAMVDDTDEKVGDLASQLADFAIDVTTGILTYGGKHFQLITIEDEEPIYYGAECGRAICGTAICGQI